MKKQLVLLSVLLISVYSPASAQQNYKAKFINAFTRYMNWSDDTTNSFLSTLGHTGPPYLYKEVSQEIMGRTVRHQNVVRSIF